MQPFNRIFYLKNNFNHYLKLTTMKKTIFSILILATLISKVHSQSSNVTLEGKWLRGNYPEAVCLNGNYGFYASGNTLSILDFSDTNAVKGLSQILAPTYIVWVSYSNNFVYLANMDSGIQIIDVSNPIQPVTKSIFKTKAEARTINVYGNFAYVADDTAGLRILNISNPSAPVEVGYFDLGDTAAYNVYVSGNYAYVSFPISGIKILDVSNPAVPILVNSFYSPIEIENFLIDGNRLFLIENNFYWPYKSYLKVLDITIPQNPILLGQDSISNNTTGGFSFPINVNGNHVYTFVGTTFGAELYIWDITNLSSIQFATDYLEAEFPPNQIAVTSDKAFIPSQRNGPSGINQLAIYDISNPSSIVKKKSFLEAGIYFDVFAKNNYAYTVEWVVPSSGFLGIYDISNPNFPQRLNNFSDTSDFYPSGTFEIYASGNYIYLTSVRIGSDYGVGIFDVANPKIPIKVGSFSVSGGLAQGISVSGNYAYVLFGNKGLYVWDVSNPSSPVNVSSLILSGGFPGTKIFISGNYAYITDNSKNLHIIDISNPASPLEKSSFVLSDKGTDISVSNNYAFVTVGSISSSALEIINVSNPSSPSLSGTYTSLTADPRNYVYSIGHFVYIGDFDNGLQVLDVSNSSSPTQVGYYYNVNGLARGVFADNKNIYLVTDGGLYLFENTFVNGIHELNTKINPIKLSPNPAHENITIEIDGDGSAALTTGIKNAEIKLFNVLGENVLTEKLLNKKQTIHCKNLPSGIYFYKLTDEKKEMVGNGKLVIQ